MRLSSFRLAHKSASLAIILSLTLSLFIVGSAFIPAPVQAAGNAPALAADLDANVAIAWMGLVSRCIQDESYTPPVASRVFAYSGITLYEAVLGGMPNNQSFSTQIADMPAMPKPDSSQKYDWPSAANGALAVVVEGLMPNAQPATYQQMHELRDQLKGDRIAAVPSDVVERSMAYGESVGKAILDWASRDNFQKTRTMSFSISATGPNIWQPDQGKKGVEPYWGTLHTFALPKVELCDVPLAISFSSDAGSAMYKQADEVYTTVKNLTPDQQTIASFWSDDPKRTSTPAGHWLSIENQIVDKLNLKLDRAAEMYALVGIAAGDAFISTWREKYDVMLLRPNAFIKSYIDPNWKTFLSTPSFPEYPSGHSVVSGAMSEVLTGLFGNVAFVDHTHDDMNLAPRSFSSFKAAAQEAALSRLYGGIHYRMSIDNGLKQGACIGQNILSRIKLNR